jgi:hypothetical protein
MGNEGKNITLQSAPNLGSRPQSYFKKNEFDIVIWSHGYDVIIERALRCPCKTKGGDNLSSCKNCGGSGWLFINPVKTKAILSSQNASTQFKDWSETNMGNVNITVRDIDKLAFMDRITALQGETIHTQTAFPHFYKGVLFAFLDYEPKSISEVFMFHKDSEKLVLLENGVDYSVADKKIILDKKYAQVPELTVSLRYTHAPQYHVIDIKRDVMTAPTYESNGKKSTQFPVSAMGRRAHYVLDRQNFNADLIYDNSYAKLCEHGENSNCNCL